MRMSQRQVAAVAGFEREHGRADVAFVLDHFHGDTIDRLGFYEDDIVVTLPNGDVHVLNGQGLDLAVE